MLFAHQALHMRSQAKLALVIALSLSTTYSPTWAQTKKPKAAVTATQNNTTDIKSVDSIQLRPVIIMFDGTNMTDARAKTIAKNAGFTFVSWSPCVSNAQHCAAIKVEGKRGHIYEYPVIDKKCFADKLETKNNYGIGSVTQATATAQSNVQGTSDNSARRRAKRVAVKNGTLATVSSSSTVVGQVTVPPPEEETGNASYCFGGFTALHRIRIEDSYTATGSGFISQLNHTYQLIVNKRWTDKVIEQLDAWDWPISGSGQSDRGHDYKLMDSKGSVVASSSDEVYYIASSTPPGPSLKDRCTAMATGYQGVFAAANQVAYDICKVVTLPLPDVVNVSGSLQPLGVGATLGGSKNMEVCSGAKDTVNTVINAATNLVINDCLENPGRYFPADYPAVTTPLEIVTDTFKSTAPEKITLEGDCPPLSTYISSFQFGSMVCTQSTPMTCEKNSKGECECKQDGHIGSKVTTVCTDA
jgi:hypothetical protein